jgi:hypothetical protein
MSAPQDVESLVTVVLAGLMFFRENEDEDSFNVGILRAAIDHTLRILGPDNEVLNPGRHAELVLEVIDQTTGTPRTGATAHRVGTGVSFDRTDPDHDAEDYRYIVDFDVLYPERAGGYQIDPEALRPNIEVQVGRVYTLCRTEFLTTGQGAGPRSDFGFMADTMGVDITLHSGERLALKDRLTGSRLITLDYDRDKPIRYIGIANIPPELTPSHHHGGLTHFQNYYLAIPKRFRDRFDFGFRTEGEHFRCPLPGVLVEFLDEKLLSPPPYFCGTGSGRQGRAIP